jgi:hypothetical protein
MRELQQPQERFTPMMEEHKIMYPDITIEPRFVFDDRGFYFANTTYSLPGGDRYLQGLLNSRLIWWFLSQSVRLMRSGYLRLFTQYVETIPIARCATANKKAIGSLSERLSHGSEPNRMALEQELQDRVAALYGLTAEERKIAAGMAKAIT